MNGSRLGVVKDRFQVGRSSGNKGSILDSRPTWHSVLGLGIRMRFSAEFTSAHVNAKVSEGVRNPP